MALWLNNDPYPADEVLDKSNGDTMDLIGANPIQTFTEQADWDGNRSRELAVGMNYLTLTQTVQQDIGGEMTPEDLIGYSTGIVPMEVTRGMFNGETIQPAQIDALYASQQYGDVGLSTRNETMVQGLISQESIFTITDATAGMTFVTPGFE